MNRPLLVVITGSAASGKTTLSRILSGKINCPLLSRDELKEGYVNTTSLSHNQLNNSADLHVYNTFFETIDLLISKDISLIVEAAFQHKLWQPKLLSLLNKAAIKIIICKTNTDLVKERFYNRFANDPGREKFHGDQSVSLLNEQFAALTENYEPVNIDVPTLHVDTSINYDPGIENIIDFIRQKE